MVYTPVVPGRPPYRVNITEQVQAGENQLEVTVVNNWMNRVIGDLNLPKAKRETWSLVNPYNKNSPLQPSGLLRTCNDQESQLLTPFYPVTPQLIGAYQLRKSTNNP